MREIIIQFFKLHTTLVRLVWRFLQLLLRICGCFVSVQPKTMLFCSFGGRKFDDSPRAIYDEVCRRAEFNDWRLIWAFADINKYKIPRGEIIKIDSIAFFKALLYSSVWVSNSGMDRGIGLHRKQTIRVETWHGTPLKKIGGDENQNGLRKKGSKAKRKLDADTIRCAQSEYDLAIFKRIFNAEENKIILCDLPRNDSLLRYTQDRVCAIKQSIGIPLDKKVILYMPTYREYLLNEDYKTYLAPPIDLKKWQEELKSDYILLIRAHYAVNAALEVKENGFVKDVSGYPYINDLYIVSDILISDYSSSFVDYAILDRPMFCFAYDLEEYELKRGLYVKLEETLPCPIDKDEDSLIEHIKALDYQKASNATRQFHNRYAPYAGHASKSVVDEILKCL